MLTFLCSVLLVHGAEFALVELRDGSVKVKPRSLRSPVMQAALVGTFLVLSSDGALSVALVDASACAPPLSSLHSHALRCCLCSQ